MPIPRPNKDEEQDAFMSRCMGDETMNEEYEDADQRAAICHSAWREEHEEKSGGRGEFERRYLPLRYTLEERDGKPAVLSGYAAVFWDGNASTQYATSDGSMVERILFGAFDRALIEDDVVATFNHDENLVLGRASAGTLRLAVDARGLRYELDLPDTSAGRDVRVNVRRGDVRGSSFSFLTRSATWRKEDGIDVRELRDVGLRDLGPVTFSAYEGTTAEARSPRLLLEPPLIREREAWITSTRLAAYHLRATQVRLTEAGSLL